MFSAADGGDLELKRLNKATVPEEWVFQAFTAAALSYSGAGPITVDLGIDTPEGYPDPTASREMVRRLLKMKGVRRGPPEASPEKVERAGELAEVGRSLREIANDLGVSKSTAGRYVQKAKMRKGQE